MALFEDLHIVLDRKKKRMKSKQNKSKVRLVSKTSVVFLILRTGKLPGLLRIPLLKGFLIKRFINK